ncbi:TPA: AraC family transcriptional regulator [Klebsiella pneumoniae]|nr:AraC family transcriptional regulator [Klebsiella pneumoniae]HBT5382035.1 AraC family transcriptional regulator [Klebsiella pneumoniae]
MIPDKSVEILLGELSRDIAQRTPGTDDFPTAVEGLELFRRNEPAPPVSCLVPPSIVLVADGAKIMWVGGEPYEYIPVLGPLIQREIHYRLLMSDQSDHLRQIAAVDGHGYRIGKAIDWLKTNIASPLRVEELASRVQMSTPSFHHHFRQLAGMSPLRYQKWLRLNEARRLMLNEHYDVTTAAYAVGYESLSHFSREYTRMFGESPKRDITELRKSAGKL